MKKELFIIITLFFLFGIRFVSYAFDGLVEKRFLSHRSPTNTEYTEEYLYAYDHARRLTTTTHKWNGASTGKVLSAKTYNELGQLLTDKKGNSSSMQAAYTYDVRSRLLTIGETNFSETLTYSYGSNILTGQTAVNGVTRKYTYGYDGLNRLLSATKNSGTGDYATNYTYDKNGNVMTIKRYGNSAASSWPLVDNITTVRDGNRIQSANDAAGTITYSLSQDFKDYVSQATEYTYNQNGAMTQDKNRGITSVTYNILNLPDQIDIKSPVAEARNEYYYSSDGVKRKVIKKWNPNYSTSPVIGSAINTSSLTQTETTNYVGHAVYVNNSLKRILTENGYIENNNYYFYAKDHLGSNRVVMNGSASKVQWTNTYPFGMSYGEGQSLELQPYKYTGKEYDNKHGLNLYDYDARFYDPALGRFMTMDPLAEKYYSVSPYAYCLNNPMRFVDPTGMFIDDYRLLQNGMIELLERTKDDYDRLFVANKPEIDPLIVYDTSIYLT
ncbi:RHS repeat-associated protein [Parabacteroides sp. PFB2-10]|uniref:RHS repeat-associated core domain-containing protein n=1 Tax=Parabacteroides sp. PFB2-10 TaxID=1742405 RepID=UPI00247558EC|nr:RHS repeat-associated core domain-containing protein [Parabacteroides sp. PFB2-10]MDH6311928.1 RHS repeat-associated protein [Parabacteroides sp. PFB2-10]